MYICSNEYTYRDRQLTTFHGDKARIKEKVSISASTDVVNQCFTRCTYMCMYVCMVGHNNLERENDNQVLSC